jgi:tetratricopeptide (TPR) repeat protein
MDRALNPANGGKARVLIIWLYAGCKSVAGRKSECAALLALLARAEELDIDDGGASNYTREWLLRVANMARHHALAYGKPRTQSIALRHLANLHSRFGDKRKAVELLEQSYQNAVSSGEVVEAAAMALDLGMALRDFGRFREVINLYDELIRKFGSLLPDPEVMRANLQKAIATKNILYDIVIDEAVEEYEEIIDPNIAWKLFETATELQKEVLHWAREHVNRPLEAEALSDLAETHFIMSVIRSEYWDRFVGYMKEFSECLLIYPDPRRKIEYHRYMTELFVRQGQITKAFRENRVGAELALAARLRFEQFDCDLQLARLVAEMDVSRMSTNLFSEADAAARQAEQYFEDYGMTDSRYYRLAVKIRQVLSRKT